MPSMHRLHTGCHLSETIPVIMLLPIVSAYRWKPDLIPGGALHGVLMA